MKVFICSIVERCFCWKSRPWSGSGSGSRSQKGFLLAHPKSGDGDGDGEDGELFLGAGGRAA